MVGGGGGGGAASVELRTVRDQMIMQLWQFNTACANDANLIQIIVHIVYT